MKITHKRVRADRSYIDVDVYPTGKTNQFNLKIDNITVDKVQTVEIYTASSLAHVRPFVALLKDYDELIKVPLEDNGVQENPGRKVVGYYDHYNRYKLNSLMGAGASAVEQIRAEKGLSFVSLVLSGSDMYFVGSRLTDVDRSQQWHKDYIRNELIKRYLNNPESEEEVVLLDNNQVETTIKLKDLEVVQPIGRCIDVEYIDTVLEKYTAKRTCLNLHKADLEFPGQEQEITALSQKYNFKR